MDASKGQPALQAFALVMLFTGMGTMLFRDFFDINGFDYPFHWVLLMEFGYAACLWLHLWSTGPSGAFEKRLPLRSYFVCCLLNGLAMLLCYVAIGPLDASTVQMMRGFRIIIVWLVDVMIYAKRQQLHHKVGLSVLCVGLALLIWTAAHESRSGSLRPILYCTASELSLVCLYLYQERLVKQEDCPPLQLVGVEGIMGMVTMVPILLIVNMTGREHSGEVVAALFHHRALRLAVPFFIFVCFSYEISGVQVSKYGSALTRAMVDVCRSAGIWGVEIIFHWAIFDGTKLLGFCLIVCGTLTYHELLPLSAGDPSCEERGKLPLRVPPLSAKANEILLASWRT